MLLLLQDLPQPVGGQDEFEEESQRWVRSRRTTPIHRSIRRSIATSTMTVTTVPMAGASSSKTVCPVPAIDPAAKSVSSSGNDGWSAVCPDVLLSALASATALAPLGAVSYTHLRAHEPVLDLVC